MDNFIRNIAILAHVDAGKTTLSERILFAAGEIRRPGKVEEGLATMDYMLEEKERGITIESGVAHFEWKNKWFNFIDTPGHIDFGAEVDTALSAIEMAVLVISGASGVETQTITAWKKLREKKIPTIIFINKLDNPDYSLEELLINVEENLGARPVLMAYPHYSNGKLDGIFDVLSGAKLIHSETKEEIVDPSNKKESEVAKFYQEALEFASQYDDEILALALENKKVTPQLLVQGLQKLVLKEECVLCYAGSAIEGFGIRSLMTALCFFAPEIPEFSPGELGQIIRVRHFKGLGEFSIFRSHTQLPRKAWPEGFEFSRLKGNLFIPVEEIRCGDIYAMRAPTEMELGKVLDLQGEILESSASHNFLEEYQPLLQTRIECASTDDFLHVEKSLKTLSRMDPSFKIKQDLEGGFWYLYTVGEVQLEVLLARLEREFGCKVNAGAPMVRFQERLKQNLEPVENSFQIGPHKIAIKLSAHPLESEAHDIRLAADFMEQAPREILAGVRSALLETAEIGILGKGPLKGICFDVHEFSWTENALPPMIKKACADAVIKLIKPEHIALHEPIMELTLECPVNYAGVVTGDLQMRNGKIKEILGDGKIHILKAEIPLQNVFGYATKVRSISKGTAVYSLKVLGYQEV